MDGMCAVLERVVDKKSRRPQSQIIASIEHFCFPCAQSHGIGQQAMNDFAACLYIADFLSCQM
jgi:hypothetical protein